MAYGIRKSLQAEQKAAEMKLKIGQLEDECEDLSSEADILTNQIQRMLNAERQEIERGEASHQELIDGMVDQNKSEFKQIISALGQINLDLD